jgi:adenylosuccinate lyase
MGLLKAISPLDGRYSSKLETLGTIVSEFGLIKNRIFIEIEWFKNLFSIHEFGLIELSTKEISLLDGIVNNFNEDECKQIKVIENTTNHDVKAVEYYIKGKIKDSPVLDKYQEFVHFACTSEDINNLSYALMLKNLQKNILVPELVKLNKKINTLSLEYKNISMMCRTHGQPATPSTMGKELYNVYYRLQRQITQLIQQDILGKINGAVGNYNAHVVSFPNLDWQTIAKEFVENKLGLTFNPYTTQIEPHDYMAEYFDIMRRINTILIDFNRDIWGYISIAYFKQKVVSNEVGSSTMPHKVNPIDFENSEGNLGLANSVLGHLSEKLPISRFQRDLTDSTVQRNIGVALGYSLLGYSSLLKGLDKLELNISVIDEDLNNNW